MTIDQLRALSSEEKRLLSAQVAQAFPMILTEAGVLQEPLTYLLAVLCEERLPPGGTNFSPSEIVAWLGIAAANRHPNPAAFVWGKLNNGDYSAQLAGARGERWASEGPEPSSPEEATASADIWEILPSEDRTTLLLSLDYSIDELAALWGISYRGAEKRIERARAALKKLSDL